MSLTISHLESELSSAAKHGQERVYVETGRYKNYMPVTLAAARRRGYRVERCGNSAFYVYPKPTTTQEATTMSQPTIPAPLTGSALNAKATELVKRALESLGLGPISPESIEELQRMADEEGWDDLGRRADVSYSKDGLGLRPAYNVFMAGMRELFAPVEPKADAADEGTPLYEVEVVQRRVVTLTVKNTVLGGTVEQAEINSKARIAQVWDDFAALGCAYGPLIDPVDDKLAAGVAVHESVEGLVRERDELLAALQSAHRLIVEALPKFNWGASSLDANAIRLLNEVPAIVSAAITKATAQG